MNVPKLRFKNDDGREFPEWEEKRLSDIAEKIQDGTHFSPKLYESGQYLYITSKNVKNGYLDLSTTLYVSEQSHNEIYKRCDVKQGDVLITKDGTIGQVCVNPLRKPFSLLSSVAFIRTKERFNNYFLYHLLLSSNGQKEIIKSIAGQALQRITLTKLNNFSYFFPTLPEQIKIANFLTAIDEKITQLTQKNDLLKQYKKGVMQQIFSQKLRFKDDDGREFPEWEEKKIGELGRFIGGGTPTTQNKDFWNGNIPWISSSDLTEESIFQIKASRFISEKAISQSATKLVPKNSVLIVSRVGVGKVAIAKEDICTSQDFTNLVLSSGNPVFFGYLIKTLTNRLLGFNQGTSIKGFVKSDLEVFEIFIPCFPEQTRIANFLTAIDDKIAQTQTQLEAVKQYKKGLLQQMFV